MDNQSSPKQIVPDELPFRFLFHLLLSFHRAPFISLGRKLVEDWQEFCHLLCLFIEFDLVNETNVKDV